MDQTQSFANFPPQMSDAPSDALLLSKFLEQKDQPAFEALLVRHGPLVLGICRRILKRHHEAEDAFQATFLSLARDASRIKRPEMLANWLYSVARHAALKIKKVAEKRNRIEQQQDRSMDSIPESVVESELLWADVSPVLDKELAGLSDELRIAVILCDFQGKTRKEVAQQLGWPEATVSSRLMKAHSLLAQRMKRYGVVLSVATLSFLIAQNAASAAVPVSLVASTLTAATAVGAAQTTVASTSFLKSIAWFKSFFQTSAIGKIALVGVSGSGIVAASVALQPQPKEPEPLQIQNPVIIGVKDIPEPVHAKLGAPFEEIAATYRKNYALIKTLRVETSGADEKMIDPEILWNSYGMIPIEPEEAIETLVLDQEKVRWTFRSKAKSFHHITKELQKKYPSRFTYDPSRENEPPSKRMSYQEILEHLPNAPVEEQESICLFDGAVVRTNNSGQTLADHDHVQRRCFNIQRPDQLRQRAAFLNPNYLDLMFYGITGIHIAKDRNYREQFRLPDLLAKGNWRVVAENELLDGAECLVIESSETNKLWLDPKIGYAVRRWTKELPYKADYHYQNHRHVVGVFYAPQSITSVNFGIKPLPDEYLGKVVVRHQLNLSRIEVNQPISTEEFQLIPPEGAWVFDTTGDSPKGADSPNAIGMVDDAEQSVNYIQPANPADVPKAINESKARQGISNPAANSSPISPGTRNVMWWIIGANLVLFAIIGLFYARRRWS